MVYVCTSHIIHTHVTSNNTETKEAVLTVCGHTLKVQIPQT